MSIAKAHINPAVLRWARETAGLSLEDAAMKADIGDARGKPGYVRLEEWEMGDDIPTRGQAESLAKAYLRPILTFYLPNPPERAETLADFRTVSGQTAPASDNILDAFMRRIRARQQEVVEILTEEDGSVPVREFVGRFRGARDAKAVSDDIRRELGVSLEDQRALRDSDALFRLLRHKVEHIGVFVMQHGNLGSHHTNIEPDLFRGIALADSAAPFIIINSNDATAARTFTLMHELAHIWTGETGISNLSPFSGDNTSAGVEAFCNDVAVHFLMPKEPFKQVWQAIDKTDLAQAIEAIAKEFSISRASAATRLWKLGDIDQAQWWALYNRYQREWQAQKASLRAKEGGPGYYTTKRSQLGNALIHTVLGALDAGGLTCTRAARILGVNAKGFDGLRAAAV